MGLHINSLTYVIICMAIGLLVDFLVHILLRWYETDGTTRTEKLADTLQTMGASIFIGGATTFLGVVPLVLSSTHIFMTVFWAFLAIVVLGFTHGLILLPAVLSVIGPVSTHHSKTGSYSITACDHSGKKDQFSPSMSSTSSTSSGKAAKFDDEILRSSTEEELEELTSEKQEKKEEEEEDEEEEKEEQKPRRPNEHRKVPFLGPSYDLEAIEEGPESNRSRPDSTRSRRSIISAPSDEMLGLGLADHSRNPPSSLLGQLADAYTCASEIDFYDTVDINACKKATRCID
jgi:Patched family